MADSKIQKQQAAVLKAQERLGMSLVKDRDSRRKRRDGRLLKLGVLAEQMFLAGDLALLAKFERGALEQFADRKVDRLDFELDDALNWFDKTREEAMISMAQKESTKAPTSAATSAAPGAVASGGAKPAFTTPARAATNGAGTTNGAAVPPSASA